MAAEVTTAPAPLVLLSLSCCLLLYHSCCLFLALFSGRSIVVVLVQREMVERLEDLINRDGTEQCWWECTPSGECTQITLSRRFDWLAQAHSFMVRGISLGAHSVEAKLILADGTVEEAVIAVESVC